MDDDVSVMFERGCVLLSDGDVGAACGIWMDLADSMEDEGDLEELIGGLTRRGIRVVDGRIVGDVSMKDSLYWGSGWLWDDAPAPYQPYLSPLMLNKGVLQLSIVPDGRGLSALVTGNPSSSYYTIENHTRSHWPAAGPLRVARNWMENGNRISLQGNVRAAEGRSFSLFDSGRMFMHVFVERLLYPLYRRD